MPSRARTSYSMDLDYRRREWHAVSTYTIPVTHQTAELKGAAQRKTEQDRTGQDRAQSQTRSERSPASECSVLRCGVVYIYVCV